MSQKTSKRSDSSWAALLQEAVAETAKTPPGDGWLQFKELRAQWGFGDKRTYGLLAKLIEAGKVERFDGQALRNGRLSRATWYRQTEAR